MNFYRDYVFKVSGKVESQMKANFSSMCFAYSELKRFSLSILKEKNKTLTQQEIHFIFDLLLKKHPALNQLDKESKFFLIKAFIKDYETLKKIDHAEHLSLKPSLFVEYKKDNFDVDFQKRIFSLKGIEGFLPDDISSLFDKKINKISFSFKYNHIYITFHTSFFKNNVSVLHEKTANELSFVGIDLGLKEFAILSNGDKFDNPRFLKSNEERLKFLQSKLANCQKNSRRFKRLKEQINKKHKHIVNARNNFLHQLSKQIVDHHDIICFEDLDIKSMSSKERKSSSVLDASWGTFIKYLTYKAEEQGKILVKINRYFPSSQICSSCQHRQKMDLSKRTFECSNCGISIDRDINAAVNIRNEGTKMFFEGF